MNAMRRSWWSRSAKVARIGAKVGGTYASTSARKVFASAERRIELDQQRQMTTASHVAQELGQMKGALMKLGQMASYLDEGLGQPMREALAQLQSHAPPMSPDLAAEVITRELGDSPDKIFVEWDPHPIAAASIGQVHRAVVVDLELGIERPVAVKVQYPGVDQAIAADLRNADLLGFVLRQGFSGLDPTEMVEEIRERLTEELDYRQEAINQQLFVDFYRGHPLIHIPEVLHQFSTARVLTTELVNARPWAEQRDQDQATRDHIGEVLFRFVFRSLYTMQAFNGDPHPGNYLFHPDGRITFLDFGLVKHFSTTEMDTFTQMVKAAAVDHDAAHFRSILEGAGMLTPDAPVDTEAVGLYFSKFYEPVRSDSNIVWTPEYATSLVRHTFDRSSPISQYSTVPKAFVFIQRINLGLYALLGELRSEGNYRQIASELWPFMQAPPTTEIGRAEADWLAHLRRSF